MPWVPTHTFLLPFDAVVAQVKAQALELLREQQQQQGDSTQPPSNPSPDGDAGTQFTGEQFRQACLQVSAVLPNMLVQLTAPRVVLPAALCEVLGEMGIQVAVAAANAVEGGAAAGQAQQEGEQQQGDAELEAVVYAQQLLTFCMQVRRGLGARGTPGCGACVRVLSV